MKPGKWNNMYLNDSGDWNYSQILYTNSDPEHKSFDQWISIRL